MEIKKKTIIILTLSLALVVIAVMLISRLADKETSKIPVDVPKASTTIQLPSGKTRDSYANISNPNDLDEIKKTFSNFVGEAIKADISETGIKTIKFIDAKGMPITLAAVSSSIGITIPRTLSNLIEDKEYDIFYCSSGGGKKDYGFVLYAKSAVGRSLDEKDYNEIAKQVRQWESSMLRDLHPLLFPGIFSSKANLDQELLFRDGKARFAEVQMPDGTKNSINYKQLGDPVVIASTLDCLEKGIGYFFDTEE